MIQTIKNTAMTLVRKHGAEVGVVAKVAAHALIPGAPLLVGAVESLCDYAADKSQELTDDTITEMIEGLGGDVQHLESLLGHLSGQLDGVVGQMSQMASFGTPPQALEAMINSALESQFSTLRDELRALTPELETVKRQQETMLRQQNLQGDMLHQVQDQLGAVLSYHEPLASQGVVGAQVPLFLGAQGRFESALFNGDLSGAEQALGAMKAISPNGNTYRLGEMALRSLRQDFSGAEQIARTLTGPGANSPRVQRAKQSLTKLTQARGAGMAKSSVVSGQDQRYEVGSKIGDRGWHLTALLGRGGMGSVWRAKNTRGQEGAVKLMSAQLSTDPQFVSRFQAEIDALDRVSHAAVIDILDWGQDRSGAWYFVMPFIEGMSLRARLSRGGLKGDEVKGLARAIASGLVACHAQGVIHRDIKPENIMFKANGAPMLIDFGIAHQEGVGTGQTQMATGGYAPPEQLAGRPVDGTADLYALGMTLAECLGPKADEDPWDNLISAMTHRKPSRRGTAQTLLDKFSEASKTYFSNIPGEDPKGPFGLQEVCAQVLAGAKELHLWWEGQSAWQKWDKVAEVKTIVDQQRKPTPPPMPAQKTPPPPPPPLKPQLKAGDRVSSEAGGVKFYERVIPAPSGGKPFMMMETQVTQALYRAVTGKSPSQFKGDNLPVESVSWEDGVAFCNALSTKLGLNPAYRGVDNDCQLIEGANGFRLPFEAEWEWAAKGGQRFKYAGSDNIDEVAWYEVTTNDEGTRPVAQLKANGYGLYDMSGNVWEWCADDSSNPGQHRPGASKRAYRGGSWGNYADDCEVSYRGSYSPGYRNCTLGLRLSRSLG